ncbi:MAG TPA: DinB family protein [Candidatus Dormibacteraeota bacterium]|nr:DinB family protein [Candidatus Dormibacteraeota bacterium]
MATARRADMFIDPAGDPRENGPRLADERTTLVEFLRCVRLTLAIKCADLDADAMARRSVEPSTMSLLGIVRHLTEMERDTFRIAMAGEDVPRLYCSDSDRDGDFEGAVPDAEVVADAWAAWRSEVDFAERFVAAAPSLDITCANRWRGEISLREEMLEMIHEYARHLGHADLLRERIDGRIGQ